MRSLMLVLFLVLSIPVVTAQAQSSSGPLQQEPVSPDQFSKLGFAPAVYYLHYKKPVLKGKDSVVLRSDGRVVADGTNSLVSFGLELHYAFTFKNSRTYVADKPEVGERDYKYSSGHLLTPYFGVFDIESGIGGMTAGVMYGYWRGDVDLKNKRFLNVGLGVFTHKDQLVLASDVVDGQAPPVNLVLNDLTRRSDAHGWTFLISAGFGF